MCREVNTLSKLPLLSLSLLTACAGIGAVQSVEEIPSAARAKAPDAMWRALVAQEPRSFIVALAPTASTDDPAVASAASIEHLALSSSLGAMPTAANRAMWSTHKARLLETAPATERVLENDWDNLPLVQVRTSTVEAALAMLDRDEVAGAYEIEHYELSDAESFPLIGQPAAAAAGKTGAGTAVAVLDTGTDYTRSDFGSCTAPGAPSTCKVAYAADFAPSDSTRDDNGHGTNVAGIVGGVAPGAKLIALDVFNGNSASTTDIISAVNWVIANRSTYNIAAMNLSLGGGASTSPCTTDALGIALGTARSAGIAPVVASGNNGYSNAISSPACAPAAISVGAVYDANLGRIGYSSCSDATTAADKITCFSNSASFLKVLAPGALITAAGYTMAGTSQATPHVAGAMAVLHAAFPSENVEQLLARLTSTGKKILDPRNGVTTPRIDVFAALAATARPESNAPVGTIQINAGAAFTRSPAVALALVARDDTRVAQMCISEGTTCSSFVTYQPTASYTFAAGDGTRTLRVWYRDPYANTSAPAVASIVVDTAAPTGGVLAATASTGRNNLSWTTASDALSGFASYKLVGAAGPALPAAACATGTVLYSGTATTFAHLMSPRATWSYRLCAIDKAGNTSTGTTKTVGAQ